MRIFGYVLLFVGIVFELLLVLARLGGGKVSPTAFAVVAILILSSWRLRAYGRPIAKRGPSSDPSTVAKPGPGPELASPTTKLPFTPAVSAVVAQEIARSRRIMVIMILGGMSLVLLLAGSIGLAVSSPLEFLAGGSFFSLALGLFVGGIWILAGARPLRRDLRESTYLRASGPVQLVCVFGGAHLLRLADRAFIPSGCRPMALAAAFRHLTWATVDYSNHSHLIFEVRDHSGRSVYRCAGFELVRS